MFLFVISNKNVFDDSLLNLSVALVSLNAISFRRLNLDNVINDLKLLQVFEENHIQPLIDMIFFSLNSVKSNFYF